MYQYLVTSLTCWIYPSNTLNLHDAAMQVLDQPKKFPGIRHLLICASCTVKAGWSQIPLYLNCLSFLLCLCEEIFLLFQTMSSSRSQTVPCSLGRRECRLSQLLVVIERSEPRHEQAICLSRWNILWHSARHRAIMLQLLVVRY